MSAAVPSIFAGMCDDAAIFPPGNLPLHDALPAHSRHKQSAHAPLVGSFVLSANGLARFATLVADADSDVGLSLTTPLPAAPAAVDAASRISRAKLDALEVALPDDFPVDQVLPQARMASQERDLPVYVELPRDQRRAGLITALAGTEVRVKLRTGGVRAELYPDELELAAAIVALVAARVPFKATAGLHHAVRNTDPDTNFEQHGFLNLLAATDEALRGADREAVAAVLAVRDGRELAERVHRLEPDVRRAFGSFGTCSIHDPVTELVALGLLDHDLMKDLA